MRNAGKIITVAAAATALVACSPPNEQPSDLPPGAEPSPTTEVAPPASGEESAAEECTAEDITVSDGDGTAPVITVPQDCAVPTELLTRDLEEGEGAAAGPDSVVELDYVMATWADEQVQENTFDEQATLTVRLDQTHEFEGWEQALTGVQEGDRRLIVVPARLGYDQDSGHPLADETVVIVADVLRVSE